MKPLTLLFVATAAAVSGCASQQPMPPGTQMVGTSQQTPETVAKCVAQRWANKAQQPVMSQLALANNQAMDVYVPGQQPPAGAAAILRPSTAANTKTWAGFRASGGAGGDASGDIKACL